MSAACVPVAQDRTSVSLMNSTRQVGQGYALWTGTPLREPPKPTLRTLGSPTVWSLRRPSANGSQLPQPSRGIAQGGDDPRSGGIEERAIRHVRARERERDVEAVLLSARDDMDVVVEHVLARRLTTV